MAKSKTATTAKPAPAAAAAKPVSAPAAVKPETAPVVAAKPAAAKTACGTCGCQVDAGERQRMIAEAAYYIAEKRGFSPGNHDQDWAEAERQIDAKIKAK
jgi:hypothetical protein